MDDGKISNSKHLNGVMADEKVKANPELSSVRRRVSTSSQKQNGDKLSPSDVKFSFSNERPSTTPLVTVDEEDKKVCLKKGVGLWSGVSLVLGNIIGSGIFISATQVAQGSGSVAMALISWGICGIISLGGALCFAEMGTLIRESGGEYSYLKRSFGEAVSFLFAWVSILLIRPCSTAIEGYTCASYLLSIFFEDGCGAVPSTIIRPLGVAIILLLCVINCYSVPLALKVQVIFTAAKVIALIAIIIGGIVKLAQGELENINGGFEGTSNNVGSVILGFYGGMWAYDGWNNLNYVVEELQHPEKDLQRSILIAILSAIFIYVMVNVSYFTVIPFSEILTTKAVAGTWAKYLFPTVQWIIPLVVAMSTFGSCNGSLFSIGRLNFVAARDGNTLEIFSMIHVKCFTPMPSLLFTTALAVIYVCTGEPGTLIDIFSFIVWFFYGAACISLIILRYKEPYKSMKRAYKVPFWIVIPVLICLASAAIVIIPLVLTPVLGFLYAAICVVIGLVFYFPFVYYKYELPCMHYITKFLQMLLQVSPAESEEQLLQD